MTETELSWWLVRGSRALYYSLLDSSTPHCHLLIYFADWVADQTSTIFNIKGERKEKILTVLSIILVIRLQFAVSDN